MEQQKHQKLLFSPHNPWYQHPQHPHLETKVVKTTTVTHLSQLHKYIRLFLPNSMGVCVLAIFSTWSIFDWPLCPDDTSDVSVCSLVKTSVWTGVSTTSMCPAGASTVCWWVTGGWWWFCLQSRQTDLCSGSSLGKAHSLCTHLKKCRYHQDERVLEIQSVHPIITFVKVNLADLWHMLQQCRSTDGLAVLPHTPQTQLRRRWQPSHTV